MEPRPEQMLVDVSSPPLRLLPQHAAARAQRKRAGGSKLRGQLFQVSQAPVYVTPLCLPEETDGKRQVSQRQTAAWEACSVSGHACATSVASHTDQTRQYFKIPSVFQAGK